MVTSLNIKKIKGTHSCPFYPPSTKNPSRNNRQEKERKGNQIGKKEAKLSICKQYELLYSKPLIVHKIFNKVIGYKINQQKSIAFLDINNELSEKEIWKTITFTIAQKRIKYPGINLTEEVKDLHTENYETLMEEILKDTMN
jgi:hypothetical protein